VLTDAAGDGRLEQAEADLLRAAALLGPEPAADRKADPVIDELLRLAAELPPEDRQELIDLARVKLERHERTKKPARKASTRWQAGPAVAGPFPDLAEASAPDRHLRHAGERGDSARADVAAQSLGLYDAAQIRAVEPRDDLNGDRPIEH